MICLHNLLMYPLNPFPYQYAINHQNVPIENMNLYIWVYLYIQYFYNMFFYIKQEESEKKDEKKYYPQNSTSHHHLHSFLSYL